MTKKPELENAIKEAAAQIHQIVHDVMRVDMPIIDESEIYCPRGHYEKTLKRILKTNKAQTFFFTGF